MNQKTGILVVSFGTSHNTTRARTIQAIEQEIQAAWPDIPLFRAWTSGMIRKKLARDHRGDHPRGERGPRPDGRRRDHPGSPAAHPCDRRYRESTDGRRGRRFHQCFSTDRLWAAPSFRSRGPYRSRQDPGGFLLFPRSRGAPDPDGPWKRPLCQPGLPPAGNLFSQGRVFPGSMWPL